MGDGELLHTHAHRGMTDLSDINTDSVQGDET